MYSFSRRFYPKQLTTIATKWPPLSGHSDNTTGIVLYCFLCHNTILQACESSLLVSNQLLLYCKTYQLTTHVSFFRVERMPHRGGRVAIFTAAQETLIVDMVRENNLIRLREIRDKVIADNVNFESIDDVSLATNRPSSPAPKDADETGL